MTMKEALEIIANNLAGISVPISLTQQIAMPIQHEIENINQLILAINMNEEAQKQEQEEETSKEEA